MKQFLKQFFADFWLRVLFAFAGLHPAIPRCTRPFWLWAAWTHSGYIRRRTMQDNGPRILGPQATPAELKRYGQGVLAGFYDFCVEVAHAGRRSVPLAEVAGQAHFDVAKARGRGVIVATAHYGSYQAGLAGIEERPLVVLFRRDVHSHFDRLRSRLHARYGIEEAHGEDGLAAWARMRDVLQAGGIAVVQADRVMPGQRGVRVPFLYGELEMPEGPVKLSRLTGAPILPAVSCPVWRNGQRQVRVVLGAPVDGDDPEALRKVADFLAARIAECPEEWHVLHEALKPGPGVVAVNHGGTEGTEADTEASNR